MVQKHKAGGGAGLHACQLAQRGQHLARQAVHHLDAGVRPGADRQACQCQHLPCHLGLRREVEFGGRSMAEVFPFWQRRWAMSNHAPH